MSTKRQKLSPVWELFTPVNSDIAKCDICKQTFSYKTSVSNLKRHLQRKHPIVSLPSLNNQPVQSLTPATQPADRKPGTSKELEVGDNAAAPSTSSTSQPQTFHQKQLPITAMIPRKIPQSSKKKIDEKLLGLFTYDFQPFSIVEDRGFVNFVKELNPGYALPSRKTVSQTMIPGLYERCLLNARAIAQNIKKVCITTDSWTSVNNESFLAVTGHFIDDEFKLRSILLECSVFNESHTSLNLATSLRRIVTEWGLERKIIFAVSDNAANIKNAISEQLGWKHFGCYAHSINLVVKNALEIVQVSKLLTKVKSIVAHFKRSSTSNFKLMQYQKNNGEVQPKKLIQDVATRWNSTFYMLQRLTELEGAVRATVAILDVSLEVISSDEWSLLKELTKILKPFEHVTTSISGEQYMSASLIIVFTSGLLDVCDRLSKSHLSQTARAVLRTLKDGVATRFRNVEDSNTLAACTFLDPRFKNIAFKDSNAAERIKKTVINMVSECILLKERDDRTYSESGVGTLDNRFAATESGEDEFSIWGAFDATASQYKPQTTASSRAILEVQRYLEDDLLPREMDALKWWSEHSSKYPNLGAVAQERLCCLATSVPCERLFSKAGNLLNERRTRLSSQKVQQLLSLNVNLSL